MGGRRYTESKEMRSIIVDTSPKDTRNRGSINLGFEIVAEIYDADRCNWFDVITKKYDRILFNVIYPTNMLNIVPFLKNNGIEILKDKRKSQPYIIAGGQGINHLGILDRIVDETFIGEADFLDNTKEITSHLYTSKNNTVIEISRGCKYSCSFCEYTWNYGGKYREKNIDLAKKQIDIVHKMGRRTVNFMSANFTGYSKFNELLEYTAHKNMRIVNTDANYYDLANAIKNKYFYHKVIKIGIESFDEDTRSRVNKKISDDRLRDLFEIMAEKMNYIHLYLIYGLPGDNYESWFDWLQWLSDLRRKRSIGYTDLFGGNHLIHDKQIRFEFNITNFEPCPLTPLEKSPPVDFEKKEIFLQEWMRCLIDYGFKKPLSKMDYKNARGRMGRKENSYKLLMQLKTSGEEITYKLINVFPKGVGRSILDDDAQKFLNYK